MSFWSDLFGRGRANPAAQAMPYFEKIPGMIQPYYDPYIQAGQQAGERYAGITGQMAQDPSGMLSQLMQGYEESPYAARQRDEALKAARASAMAGGVVGTPQDLSQQANIAAALTGQGMQDWLRNVMGIQQSGLGAQQHLYDIGYGAGTGLAGQLANVQGTLGGLAFQKQAQQNQAARDILKALMQGAGAIGGAVVGGPAGASIGSTFMGGGAPGSGMNLLG